MIRLRPSQNLVNRLLRPNLPLSACPLEKQTGDAARLRTRSKNRYPTGERSIRSEAIIRKIVSISHWLSGVRQPLAAGLRLARPKRKIETAAKHGEWEIPKENRHDGPLRVRCANYGSD
jgi:hypothetical protein